MANRNREHNVNDVRVVTNLLDGITYHLAIVVGFVQLQPSNAILGKRFNGSHRVSSGLLRIIGMQVMDAWTSSPLESVVADLNRFDRVSSRMH